jgi:glycosyltransferase involved in cell wall biosynthesis
MGKTIRYFITGIIGKSVANSQIFNWGEVLAERGLKTKFVIFYRSKQDVLKMTADATQPIIKIPIIKFFIVRNIIHFVSLFGLYFIAIFRYRKVIFQSRNSEVAPSLAILRIFPGVKIVSDIRGFEIEQFHRRTLRARIRFFTFNFYTGLFLHATDKIFCVSSPMIRILTERYNLKKKQLFAVFGGVADEKSFYYNKDLRYEMRKEFGVENKTLLMYSGMLDKPWQQPEKYFDFFKAILKINPELFLVMLTPDIKIANELKLRYNIEDKDMLIKESRYTDLVKYYNMADFGLLFRKNETVNRVASPTKFSEYSLCGLPVIISVNIGDYSDYITTTGFGYVVQDNEHIELECDAIAHYISHNKSTRENIATSSKELFSKQAQVGRLLKIYDEV